MSSLQSCFADLNVFTCPIFVLGQIQFNVPNLGVVQINAYKLDLDKSLNCPPAGGWQPCLGLPITKAGVCLVCF